MCLNFTRNSSQIAMNFYADNIIDMWTMFMFEHGYCLRTA
jgi:hypothetical protein